SSWYIIRARAIWRTLLVHFAIRPRSTEFVTAARSSEASIAITAITTRSSTRVKAHSLLAVEARRPLTSGRFMACLQYLMHSFSPTTTAHVPSSQHTLSPPLRNMLNATPADRMNHHLRLSRWWILLWFCGVALTPSLRAIGAT